MSSRRRAARTRTAAAVAAMAPEQSYMFNPGPEFSEQVRMDGAGIVNSGRFSVVAGSGGNDVLIGAAACGAEASNEEAYRATACPARCQCPEFQKRAACQHVLAAMIVRAGFAGDARRSGSA